MFVCCDRKLVLLVKWHTIKCLRFNLGFSWYVLPALNCSCLLVIRQKLLLTTHHFHHTNTSEGENDITLFDDKSWRIARQARVWLATALQGLVLLFCGRQTDLHWKQPAEKQRLGHKRSLLVALRMNTRRPLFILLLLCHCRVTSSFGLLQLPALSSCQSPLQYSSGLPPVYS